MVQFIRKKVDQRVRNLVENNVLLGHRSFIVLVGDHGKDQVMYLHFMLSKARVSVKPSVLWCYKKELGFSSHRKKRLKQHTAMLKKGLKNPDTDDPFELFISGTNIRYCYYKETEKILGNTFGMLVLQDFEAMTPNLLARTIETVEGGGIVVLLLRSLTSLKQLYTLNMDVHARYRTEAYGDVTARFNERFILSLGGCHNCLVVDDELNVLPISEGRNVTPLPLLDQEEKSKLASAELVDLKKSLADTQPAGALVNLAKTVDQAKAVLTFIEAISAKTLKSTVALTAARGRGKSAALGLSMASAIAYGYANIFVTSPSPENLKTLFEFVFKAFDALGYEEHLDYDIVQSTNPDFNKAIIRVNVFRNHRQTIQYIQPQDSHVLGQAELVIIDEAAAIPLPLVKKLMGPYLIFMASTINGYEGTGRSLSLKLIQQLREQSTLVSQSADQQKANGGRVLREIKLEEPIRYNKNDPTEKWLNQLLCLDSSIIPRSISGCPHPNECQLYNVNRDTLFCYHPVSELFLQRMMALYVSSHYKNTPNDLQLMSDAPAHELFVLLPPIKDDDSSLPEPLVVIQVCMEGQISKDSLLNSLNRGKRADGDLIPWTVAQQFQDDDFATLSGARVVRIATHPDYVKMGYGARALDQLIRYFEGEFPNTSEKDEEVIQSVKTVDPFSEENNLHTEKLKVRDAASMPPLLLNLNEKSPPNVQWIGVSYGLTANLHRFWKRNAFIPVYLRQTPNDLTGEHTCIMLRTIQNSVIQCDTKWLSAFWHDFKKRFLNLLSFQFSKLSPVLALNILDVLNVGPSNNQVMTKDDVDRLFSGYDLKRLESYAGNMLDYHVIMDMIPSISFNYFMDRFISSAPESIGSDNSQLVLSAVQKSIILSFGLQHKSVETVAEELNIPVGQVLSLFIRTIRKVSEFLHQVCTKSLSDEQTKVISEVSSNPVRRDIKKSDAWDPTTQTLDEDLAEGAIESIAKYKEKQREFVNSLDLSQYAIGGTEKDWDQALKEKKGSKLLLSVKNPDSAKSKRKHVTMEEVMEEGRKLTEKKYGSKGKKKHSK